MKKQNKIIDQFPLSPKTLRRIRGGIARLLPPGAAVPPIQFSKTPVALHCQDFARTKRGKVPAKTRNTFRKMLRDSNLTS